MNPTDWVWFSLAAGGLTAVAAAIVGGLWVDWKLNWSREARENKARGAGLPPEKQPRGFEVLPPNRPTDDVP